jgi:V8-like Glu-specific endopeptidase
VSVDLSAADRGRLVEAIALRAASDFVGPIPFFRGLVTESNLPSRWKTQLAGVWTGNPSYDAQRLVSWAASLDVNPNDARFTTLGTLLDTFLKDQGVEDATSIVAVIVAYDLYRDATLRTALQTQFQVPEPLGVDPEPARGAVWLGPSEELELQRWFQPDPDFLDVGFLTRALQRTGSVCRVETTRGERLGSGVLVGDALALTNYHVLAEDETRDITARAHEIILRFGAMTTTAENSAGGQSYRLAASEPIVKSSPSDQLDFVLMRLDDAIRTAAGVLPAPYDTNSRLEEGVGLNILQHPHGEAMKLAISTNGVSAVFKNSGLVQYVTRAAGGSSGSPCFNDDWNLVALHHAERSRAFGAIREGILFTSIHEHIEETLSAG